MQCFKQYFIVCYCVVFYCWTGQLYRKSSLSYKTLIGRLKLAMEIVLLKSVVSKCCDDDVDVCRTWTMRRCCTSTPRTEDRLSRMNSSSSNKFTNRSKHASSHLRRISLCVFSLVIEGLFGDDFVSSKNLAN